MEAIALLALLGLGLVVTTTLDDRASDDDADDPPDDDFSSSDGEDAPSAPLGQDLVYSGQSTLAGTGGDDTLRADNSEHAGDWPEEVLLGDGDDLAEVYGTVANLVDGGAGDDTLSGLGPYLEIRGGDGDDDLAGYAGSTITGDAGNDIIAVDQDRFQYEGATILVGGDGIDRLTVTTRVGDNFPEYRAADITGGPGGDTFDLNVTLEDVPAQMQYLVEDDTVQLGTADFTDFTPGEDVLTIEVTRPEGAAPRPVAGTEIVRTPEGDAVLELTFDAIDDAPAAIMRIGLGPAPGVTLDDIAILER